MQDRRFDVSNELHSQGVDSKMQMAVTVCMPYNYSQMIFFGDPVLVSKPPKKRQASGRRQGFMRWRPSFGQRLFEENIKDKIWYGEQVIPTKKKCHVWKPNTRRAKQNGGSSTCTRRRKRHYMPLHGFTWHETRPCITCLACQYLPVQYNKTF